MMALPAGFLPFDPNRDNDDSDEDDDEEEEEEEISCAESDEDNLPDSISNGQKRARHIGGGVLLVREISMIFSFLQKTNKYRVQQVNVYLLQC